METKTPIAHQLLEQWDKMSDYVTIRDKVHYDEVLASHADHTAVAFDTETTGVDIFVDELIGYSFSFKSGTAFWVPIAVDPNCRRLNRLLKDRTVLVFNAGFDVAIAKRYGVTIPKYDDTTKTGYLDVMIACFLRDVLGYKHNAGLKAQAELILSLPTITLDMIIAANKGVEKVKKEEIDFTLLTPDQARIYGCQDADITLQLWEHPSMQKAVNSQLDIFRLEHDVIEPVMSMYANGIDIDLECVEKLDGVLAEECAKCESQVWEQVPDELASAVAMAESLDPECATEAQIQWRDRVIKLQRLTKKKGLNLGSSTQKQILLFDVLNCPKTRRTTTGHSTDQEALESIETSHAVVPIVRRYMQLVSRRSMYTGKLPEMVHPQTGRIHPTLWATGVRSGRFSCSAPNLQGVSKDESPDDPARIRDIFVARKGEVLTAGDYSQIELRITASLSQEPLWLKTYMSEGGDLHSDMAMKMYGTVEGGKRSIAKTANFSILTGISAHTLYARNRKAFANVQAAQEAIDLWFESVPRVKRWIDSVQDTAYRQGYMSTYFGRVRPFPEIQRPSEQAISMRIEDFKLNDWAQELEYERLREIATRSLVNGHRRKALSHIIQGTAADIIKIAIVRVWKAINKERIPIEMLLTVHDELLFRHPENITQEAHALIREAMTFPCVGEGWVPLTVDIGSGHNWTEAKKH